jgi:dipeptidyl aminopeptidase/acylaminoacyl peptidase
VIRRRSAVWLLVAFAVAAGGAEASDRYDPRLKFRTMSTRNFDIHFHQGEDALARRLAALAEATAKALEPKLGRSRERIHVILVNQNDPPNGWASPLPYNVIEITVAAPGGSSGIGNTSDWLHLVFVHEYTHILHLDRSRGLFGGLRRVFGRHPLLMPNLFVPPWQIEGLATYQESGMTGEGRVRAGDFRLMLDRAAGARRFASLDRASSSRVDWPSGDTPYLYGAYFHDYLARTYGDASLSRLADRTAGRLPYLGSGAFDKVFGKPLGQLWKDFEADAERKAAAGSSIAARLTHHGFVVSSPTFSPDGRLFYAISNPHRFPSLMELRDDGSARQVTTRVGGGRMAAASREIVFGQLEFVRSVGVQSDLFAVERDSGSVRRLTREARAADPDLSPDGRTLVCTIQEADRRLLATLPADSRDATPAVLSSEAGTHYASPRWSPDGRTIAAERRRVGGTSDIVLLDPTTGAVVRILSPAGRGRSVAPSWLPDGRGVLFASDRLAGAFQVYAADLDQPGLRRLINAGDSAQSPALSPDGRTLVFVGYTHEGFDLFSIPWEKAEWMAQTAGSPDVAGSSSTREESAPQPSEASQGSGPAGLSEPVHYRPWGMLRPRFWTPIVEPDGDDTAVGAATSGADALGRHLYAAGAAWSTRGRPDWYAAYVYDRWRPRLFGSMSDDTDPFRSGTVRTIELDAGLTLPFRTFRRTQSVFGAFHASGDRFECGACAPVVDRTIQRHALRTGWSFNSARLYGYSISPEHGVTASIAGEWSPRAFGSTGNSRAIVADLRGFAPLSPRHGVVALRTAVAASWGDEGAAREFSAGGSGPPVGGSSFDRDGIALIRGFDLGDVTGRRALVLNADYRIPLVWVERGIGSWPLFLRSLHGAVFADAGAAWTGRLTTRQRRASVGLELSADLLLGFAAPLTVASGLAWRHDPTGASRGAAWFGRIGRAF